MCTATASVYQMLRGSIIVFSGVLSVIFLKRKLYINNWLGMALATGGIVLVGYASLQNTGPSAYVCTGGVGVCLCVCDSFCPYPCVISVCYPRA